jgi:Salmonella virulence plasmid 65kDa B protein
LPDGIDARADNERARSEQSSRRAQSFRPDEASPSTDRSRTGEPGWSVPQITLPKGGGAIRGIGEKFATNPATGTGSFAVPITASPGRDDFGPKLDLTYDSGFRNGPFGLGWGVSLPEISRTEAP